MKKLFLTILISFILFSSKLYAIDTKAEQAIVMDFDTNEILFEKNSNIKKIFCFNCAPLTKKIIQVLVFFIIF